jgi:hypothetical protein
VGRGGGRGTEAFRSLPCHTALDAAAATLSLDSKTSRPLGNEEGHIRALLTVAAGVLAVKRLLG